MLKANTIGELYTLLNSMEPEQFIQVPAKLLFELHKRAESPVYVHNFEQREMETVHCNNKDEAQALANFLWNEGKRHERDIEAINKDLDSLWIKWHVGANCIRRFVKP